MRDQVQQAQQATNTAATTAGTYGSQAQGIGANLTPFLTRQMTNPQGMSQRDIGAQLTSSLAGSGGATSALTGAANKQAMTTRNPTGFSAALGEAAMARDKAGAGTGERIAANNAQVKLQQQDQAQQGLGRLYGMNANAQNDASGQISRDVDAAAEANKTGWAQNTVAGIDAGTNVFKALFPKGLNG